MSKRRFRRNGAGGTILVLAAVGAVGYLAWRYWGQKSGPAWGAPPIGPATTTTPTGRTYTVPPVPADPGPSPFVAWWFGLPASSPLTLARLAELAAANPSIATAQPLAFPGWNPGGTGGTVIMIPTSWPAPPAGAPPAGGTPGN